LKSKRNCSIFKGSCFERLGGYLTIPFKQALKNLPLLRGQSVNLPPLLLRLCVKINQTLLPTDSSLKFKGDRSGKSSFIYTKKAN
ncbi:hypothetical protein OGM63_03810, partial [Plectonema radiosum NIES-515]